MTASVLDLPPLKISGPLTPNRYIWAIIRYQPKLLAVNVFCIGVSSVAGVLVPVAIGQGIKAVERPESSSPWLWIWIVLLLGISQAVSTGLLTSNSNSLWVRVTSVARHEIAVHIARLGSTLRSHTGGAGVVARAGIDVANIGRYSVSLGSAIGSILAFAVASVVLLSSSLLLGTITLIGVPLAILSITPFYRQQLRHRRERRRHLEKINDLAGDVVAGLRILRGIGGERRFFSRFANANRQMQAAGVNLSRSEAWLATVGIALPSLITVIITWIGARMVISGELNLSELITFYGISIYLVVPVSSAIQTITGYSSIRVAADGICTLLSLRPSSPHIESPLSLPFCSLEIHDPVSNFTARAGKLTVVETGESDVHLAERLAGLIDTESEKPVLIDGIPVNKILKSQLRERVALARSQDIWFSGTIRDKVNSEKISAIAAEVALEAADAGDIIGALPEGIDELIGERGREVSGGQRQRLNLARALALNSDVLILDEPTSAVDAHTESRIAERVKRLRQGQTTIVFSQSPLWTAIADDVFREGQK